MAAAATTTHKNPIIIFFTTYTFLILHTTFALNSDGTYLLAFRYSILNDPLSTLSSWHYHDLNPCSWSGVTCTTDTLRVTSLNLANSQLLGSIPPDLFLIENLQHLDLSNNFFNGTVPETLFTSPRLQSLSLANNEISGELPEKIMIPELMNYLNLSDNALSGSLSASWNSSNNNLSVVSLKGNYFSGSIPSGWNSIQSLDLSSNLFNGTLPESIGGGERLSYLNISNNKLNGEIPPGFASNFLENSTIDLSFNNLTGEIPETKVLVNQKLDSFIGNPDLCGKPLKNPCLIPSSLSNAPPNVTNSTSPAIAVIPRTDHDDSSSDTPDASLPDDKQHRGGSGGGGLKPMTIVGITVADLAGIGLLGGILLWLYQLRKKKQARVQQQKDQNLNVSDKKFNNHKDVENQHQFSLQLSTPSPKPSIIRTPIPIGICCPCIKGARNSPDTESHTSDEDGTTSTENRTDTEKRSGRGGTLVMVDGETELELETLLKASAYILGASGGSIVYKAVLENGMTFAVRRLGDIGVERMKDFENQMRMIAKLKHPNLVKVRGFYWAKVEKLMICDYVSNGSLASSTGNYKKVGVGSSATAASPSHLPLEIRLKIAKGIAKALSYIHDKKFVHGNIKPNNILLTPDMNPIITDLGLNWLIHGTSTTTTKATSFGSKRSHEFTTTHEISGSPYIGSCSSNLSPYQAPESLKNLKPNPKWDVYSFGIVLLELLTGRVCMEGDMGTPAGMGGDRYWVLRAADVGIRAEIQGREEIMASVFKLGFSCVNQVPNKRPSMKEALQVIEKIPLSWCQ